LLPSSESRVSLFAKHVSARSVILANDGGLPPHPSPLPQHTKRVGAEGKNCGNIDPGLSSDPRWGSLGKERPPAASQTSNLQRELRSPRWRQPSFTPILLRVYRNPVFSTTVAWISFCYESNRAGRMERRADRPNRKASHGRRLDMPGNDLESSKQQRGEWPLFLAGASGFQSLGKQERNSRNVENNGLSASASAESLHRSEYSHPTRAKDQFE